MKDILDIFRRRSRDSNHKTTWSQWQHNPTQITSNHNNSTPRCVFLHCPSKRSLSSRRQTISFINYHYFQRRSWLHNHCLSWTYFLYQLLHHQSICMFTFSWCHFYMMIRRHHSTLCLLSSCLWLELSKLWFYLMNITCIE